MHRKTQATSCFLDHFDLTPREADLAALGTLTDAFAAIPWENLTKYLKKHRPVDGEALFSRGSISSTSEGPEALPEPLRTIPGIERLRLAAEVMEDHAALGSGGTCFSLTNLLWRIVTDLGFAAYPAMADMRHGPNIHCGLIVVLGGKRWLLDPGYLVAEPVPLDVAEPARIVLPGHRLEYRRSSDGLTIEMYTVNARGEESFRYRLRPEPVSLEGFVAHWLASFDDTGMNGLHLNRLSGDGRLSAHNDNLRIDTGKAKRNVKLKGVYAAEVARRFGLREDLVQRVYEEWEGRRWRKS